jgi:Abnormal spindle-like microcephaly-assoc'd, ASPM-SPD-2-Hydin
VGPLDRLAFGSDNCQMEKEPSALRLRHVGCFLAVPLVLALAGCAGVSSGSQQSQGAGQIGVTPITMSFGNVAVGSNSVQKGALTAGSADITVSSAAWNGQGYSVSGITFPVTVPAGQSVPFTVTFAPQTAGNTPGSIGFDSNATNSPTTETLAGNGTQQSQHSVALSWNPSTSVVVGYNVYRRIASGGSFAKVNTSVDGATGYTDTSVQSGLTYDYVTTAVDSSNVESAYSNQATAVIP